MNLETERLIIREPLPADYMDLWKNGQDRILALYTNEVTDPFTQNNARDFIKKYLKLNQRGTACCFVIELKQNQQVIGQISLHHLAKDARNAELGYWISLKYRRQGIASEAVASILKFAFEELKLEKVYTRIAAPNLASRLIMNKFHFKLEGYARRQMCRLGIFMDRMDFGLLKEEYFQQARANKV